jgi:hypothetical protein
MYIKDYDVSCAVLCLASRRHASMYREPASMLLGNMQTSVRGILDRAFSVGSERRHNAPGREQRL